MTNDEVETLDIISQKTFNRNDPNLKLIWLGDSMSSRLIIDGTRVTINGDTFCLPSNLIVSGEANSLRYSRTSNCESEPIVIY